MFRLLSFSLIGIFVSSSAHAALSSDAKAALAIRGCAERELSFEGDASPNAVQVKGLAAMKCAAHFFLFAEISVANASYQKDIYAVVNGETSNGGNLVLYVKNNFGNITSFPIGLHLGLVSTDNDKTPPKEIDRRALAAAEMNAQVDSFQTGNLLCRNLVRNPLPRIEALGDSCPPMEKSHAKRNGSFIPAVAMSSGKSPITSVPLSKATSLLFGSGWSSSSRQPSRLAAKGLVKSRLS